MAIVVGAFLVTLAAASVPSAQAGALAAALPPECLAFRSRRLVYVHVMKCGGLSVDAMLKCRCASPETPCALLREDGSAKHASNASGDLITRFRDSMLYGRAECGGGSRCMAAGVGGVPADERAAAAANVAHAAALRVSRRRASALPMCALG